MKDDWEYMPVSAVADHRLGKMLDKRKNKGDFNPYLRNVNVRWFGFDLSDLKEMRFTNDEFNKYAIEKGDLVICEGGYPGRAAIWESDETILFQKALHRVRFHEPERNEWFLYYLFYLDSSGLLSSHFTGSGIQHFTGQTLAKLVVPLPPLPEQKRIVAILDEAFGAIEKAKENAARNLANAKELFDSYLDRVFTRQGEGWRESTLEEISQINSGGTPLKSTKEFWDGGDLPWYSSGELNDLYTSESKKFITPAGLKGSNAKLFPPGSLLMGMYDTAALKMSILDREATFNQAVAGMLPSSSTDSEFLLYAVRHVRPEVLKLRRGVRQKNLSLAKIKAIEISIPNRKFEQTQIAGDIARFRTKTESLESISQQKLAALDELKQSILQKAFTGQLIGKSSELELVG